MAGIIEEETQPLTGFVLCCTAVPSEIRGEIDIKARKMGAKHRVDLMSDVTHIIVNPPEYRDKYFYAVKNRPDIVFLRVEFVFKLHEKWISGYDLNIDQEIMEYGLLRPFDGLSICLSNVSLNLRSMLAEHIRENGGHYSATLSRSVDVLALGKTSGDKYEYAKRMGIKVTHFSWVQACIKRGAWMKLNDFGLDLDDQVRAERLEAVCVPRLDINSTRVKENREANQALADGHVVSKPSMLKRTKSETTWNSFMDELDSAPEKLVEKSSSSVISGLVAGPFEVLESRSVESLSRIMEEEKEREQEQEQEQEQEYSSDTLFKDHAFYFHEFPKDKYDIISAFVKARGAEVVLDAAKSTHFVVLFDTPPTNIPKLPPLTCLVTEWYIEQSEFCGRPRPPSSWTYSKYYGSTLACAANLSIKGKTVSISGFRGMDYFHINKFITSLGAKFEDTLTADRDLLIVPIDFIRAIKNGEAKLPDKIIYARKWGVPIMSDEWLLNKADWSDVNCKRSDMVERKSKRVKSS
ncbi:hypothetical protein V1514DRAFT_333139 [Lipomyces japonicus]|uniref:uncharacterized protein n=1 Tax=Lipomyces japonicus TaxID=56871 RepID=UPI0034D01FA1